MLKERVPACRLKPYLGDTLAFMLDCADNEQVCDHACLNGFAFVTKHADFDYLSNTEVSPQD